MKHIPGESWADYRRRMLRETERFIEWGLRHPDKIVRIPIKPVSRGSFPRQVGEWFWNAVLSVEPARSAEKFRNLLRRGARGVAGAAMRIVDRG